MKLAATKVKLSRIVDGAKFDEEISLNMPQGESLKDLSDYVGSQEKLVKEINKLIAARIKAKVGQTIKPQTEEKNESISRVEYDARKNKLQEIASNYVLGTRSERSNVEAERNKSAREAIASALASGKTLSNEEVLALLGA